MVGHLLSAQGVILGSRDQVPHGAPCMEPASPSACVSASLSVSLMNKIKSKNKIKNKGLIKALFHPRDTRLIFYKGKVKFLQPVVLATSKHRVKYLAPLRQPSWALGLNNNRILSFFPGNILFLIYVFPSPRFFER